MSTWTATWPDGTEVTITDTEWSTAGPDADGLDAQIVDALDNGWPQLPGWSIDRSPGFDDEWNYLRLIALGAVHVDGPFPQVAETVDAKMETDLVVG